MKTIVEPSGPTPSSAANAAASAASATGPRKKSPGVTSSPTPSATATSTQTSQPTLGDSSRGRAPRAARAGRRAGRARPGSGPRGRRARPCMPTARAPSTSSSIVSPTIAASPGGDVEQLEHAQEDRLVRLRLPVRARGEDRVDDEAVVLDEHVEVARGVREQAELQPAGAQRLERRQHVVEELEVVGVLPGARHLGGAGVRVADPAHALDDPLGEEDPDLLVVVELRVPLERRERGAARLVVARRVELEAVPRAEPPVALGPEVGPRLRDREVDVEDNGAQPHLPSVA